MLWLMTNVNCHTGEISLTSKLSFADPPIVVYDIVIEQFLIQDRFNENYTGGYITV